MEMYDTDKNGFLDAAELEKVPGLKAAFPGASKVTPDDIAARIADWKNSRWGRLSFMVTVEHNGRPLADATVTFVPESFLGSEIPTATGKTDATGGAMISAPVNGPQDAPGVAPGFYRVQITKSGENIPAKYNTQTILGEVVPSVQEGQLVYNLQY